MEKKFHGVRRNNPTKKLILTENQQEVKVGDVVNITMNKHSDFFGDITIKQIVTITEYNIGDLINAGVLKYVYEENNPINTANVSTNLSDYISLLSDRLKLSFDSTLELLDRFNSYDPAIVLEILLREISDKMEFCYNNNNPVEHYYAISRTNGNIISSDANSKDYYSCRKTIPLFRTEEDAKKAKEILALQIKLMYGEGK